MLLKVILTIDQMLDLGFFSLILVSTFANSIYLFGDLFLLVSFTRWRFPRCRSVSSFDLLRLGDLFRVGDLTPCRSLVLEIFVIFFGVQVFVHKQDHFYDNQNF